VRDNLSMRDTGKPVNILRHYHNEKRQRKYGMKSQAVARCLLP
jgi:hypothetical protein